ncbi:hypothetical protein DCAR_0103771 [Daucus carota subsp. sativus]|uniref:PGG domain-containing protein n=1 Tax=Daucus carota subsp. sativus TaxID=79200 RepID=A0AAF1AL81_DAUCS|nr:hypothetical protein DCAR_0103771 [Daucus carota subsp. sativus]
MCCNKRVELLEKLKRWGNLEKKAKNKGDSLLVAATVIASMAYQAAISPPGGHETGNSNSCTTDPMRSKLFWIFDTISFIASLSIIFLFVNGISAKRRFFIWVMRAAMWITVQSMALAYLLAAVTLIPDPNIYNRTYVTFFIAAGTWYGLIIVSLLLLIYRLVDAASRKAKKSRDRNLRNTSAGVYAEGASSIV